MLLRSRTARSRNRRGATLVLVAVMILVFGGLAAFAIDLARVYAGVSELQTGADAAALAGAHRLMLNAGQNAVSHVQTFAANNSAFGTALALDTSDVRGGRYDPATGAFTPGAWSTANAVRVTARRNTRLSFGQLAGVPQLTPSRTATAWIGNQASADCIKPWGINVSYLNGLLGAGNAITNESGLAVLRTKLSTLAGQRSLTVIAGPDVNNKNKAGNDPATVYAALTLSNNSSNVDYENAIKGGKCGDNSADLTVGGTARAQPGNGLGDIPKSTADAIESPTLTCKVRTGTADATCYDPVAPGIVEGITVTVAAISGTGNTVTVNGLIGFRVMCIFRGGSGSSANDAAITGEKCKWLTDMGVTDNNYVRGTIVGYPVLTVARTGIGNSLGNTIGPARKLVLVQ